MSEEVKLLKDAKDKLEAYKNAKVELGEALQAVDDYMNELAEVRNEIKHILEDEADAEPVVKDAEPVEEKKAPARKPRKAAAKKPEPVKEEVVTPVEDLEEETPEEVATAGEEVDLFSDDAVEVTPVEEKKESAAPDTDSGAEDDDDFDFDKIEF